MKRIFCIGLALCLLAALFSGCKKKESASAPEPVSSALSSEALSAPTPTPTPAPKAKAAQIKASDGLYIRAEASTDGEILGLAENGSRLPLLMETASSGWYEVEYQGKSAYIYAEYADVVEVSLEEYNRLRSGEAPAQSQAGSEDPQAGQSTQEGEASSQPAASTAPAEDDEDGE